jgi:aerobic-type carbon monoxide dehydrogenase small subunit (CoxS/CutS family)
VSGPLPPLGGASASATDALVPGVRFDVNGTSHEVRGDALRRLVDVLREELGLTGTKEVCGVGVCGACSVLVDGALQSACLLPVGLVAGRAVTTIEGLGGPGGELSALQAAFVTEGGLQCGACTPGQVVAATALLHDIPRPTDGEIDEWMAGNLCRCTGYEGIRRSIRAAAAGAGR